MTEIIIGLDFLINILSADTTLASLAPGGVWRSVASPNIATPFVVVAYQGGKDSLTTDGVRPLVTAIYQCKAVGPANITDTIVQAASQIDILLGGNHGLRNVGVPGGFIGSCYRDGSILMDELVAGEKFTNIGGLYSLQVSQGS